MTPQPISPTDLLLHWTTLYKTTLPRLARSKSPVQPHWPVHLDHCFARIIYDAVIGHSLNPESGTSCPWTDKLKAPAVKNMHAEDMKRCIELGEEIAAGKVDLVELDRASLSVRGKVAKGGGKRKREREGEEMSENVMQDKRVKKSPSKKSTETRKQPDIRTAMGFPMSSSNPSPPPPAQIPPTLTSKITLHPTLTPFRKRVLLTLCQVPPGHYTTYLSISNHLHSSPRAVGNALRNNPFAPQAPCHRVVAADGGIGGFGGQWGVKGEHNGEKVRLLREEGVVVSEDDSRVVGRVWEGFVDSGQGRIDSKK